MKLSPPLYAGASLVPPWLLKNTNTMHLMGGGPTDTSPTFLPLGTPPSALQNYLRGATVLFQLPSLVLRCLSQPFCDEAPLGCHGAAVGFLWQLRAPVVVFKTPRRALLDLVMCVYACRIRYDKVFGETNGVAHVGLAGYEHEPVFGDACFVVACALRLSNVVGGETRELCHVRTMYVYFWKHVFIDADILVPVLCFRDELAPSIMICFLFGQKLPHPRKHRFDLRTTVVERCRGTACLPTARCFLQDYIDLLSTVCKSGDREA